MLVSPLLHQKSKQQREPRDLAAEKRLRKGCQGKTHKPFPRSFSLATPAAEVNHVQKEISFVSWLLPFPFSPCDIPSIDQKALVKCSFFYKAFIFCSLVQYLLACLLLVSPQVSFVPEKGGKEPAQGTGFSTDLPVPPATQTLFLVSWLPEICSLPRHLLWPHAATGV